MPPYASYTLGRDRVRTLRTRLRHVSTTASRTPTARAPRMPMRAAADITPVPSPRISRTLGRTTLMHRGRTRRHLTFLHSVSAALLARTSRGVRHSCLTSLRTRVTLHRSYCTEVSTNRRVAPRRRRHLFRLALRAVRLHSTRCSLLMNTINASVKLSHRRSVRFARLVQRVCARLRVNKARVSVRVMSWGGSPFSNGTSFP